jgi:Asp-tRNA(Asn)/Glu-tRNA(Gln) amidotransferase A subunit family amidase
VGLQIIGAQHRDDVVLRLARVLEQTQPWQRLAS